MPKPVLHGRDHRPGGADPIEGLGGGGGIIYDFENEGNWLWIEAHQSVNDLHFWGGINLWDDSGYGIIINSYGGLVEAGEATIEILGDDGIDILTDNSVSSTHGGDINIISDGTGADINLISDRDITIDAEGGIWIEASGNDVDGVYISGKEAELSSWGGYVDIGSAGGPMFIHAGGGSYNLELSASANVEITGTDILIHNSSGDVIFDALPTSAPATTGAVWNDSGTLKIV